jgi:pimeloyl-ACP methyl ester carboxylesterase
MARSTSCRSTDRVVAFTRREAIALAAAGVALHRKGPLKRELVVTGVAPARQAGVPDGVVRVEYASAVDGARDWALLWPPKRDATWVVMVHGHGSHGDQLYTRPDIRDAWLPEFRRAGAGLLTPNLRDNAWMSPAAAADLRDLLAHARKVYGAKRFVFASGSMGGTSNLIYAALHPEDVAAVVALCPATDLASYYTWCREADEGVRKEIADAIRRAYGGDPRQRAAVYATHSALKHAERLTMPVFMAHGSTDAVIPVSQSRRLAGAMAEARDFVYVEVPDGDHDSPLPLMATAFRW